MILMDAPLWLTVGPRSLKGGLSTYFLNMRPLDYTAFVVGGKVEFP